MRLFSIFSIFFLPSLRPQKKEILSGFVHKTENTQKCIFYVIYNLQTELLCAGLKKKKYGGNLQLCWFFFLFFFFSLKSSVIHKFTFLSWELVFFRKNSYVWQKGMSGIWYKEVRHEAHTAVRYKQHSLSQWQKQGSIIGLYSTNAWNIKSPCSKRGSIILPFW